MNSNIDSSGFSWAPMFMLGLKLLLLFSLVIAVSWSVAIFWSSHGDAWRRLLPDFVKRTVYSILKGILSSDVAEAEDQLDFGFFWIPSFLMSLAIAGLGYYLRRYFAMR